MLVALTAFFNSIKNYRRQQNVEILMKYAERYERILEQFPESALAARFDMNTLPPESAKLRLCVLKYLNLCSEEYYLMKHGFLSVSLWQIWEADLKRILASPLLRREWPLLRREFLSHSDFVEYLENAQRESLKSMAAHV
jgi:hypothetical protein